MTGAWHSCPDGLAYGRLSKACAIFSAAFRQTFAEWWLLKGKLTAEPGIEARMPPSEEGGLVDAADVDDEAPGKLVKELHEHVGHLRGSWPLSMLSAFVDFKSQCFPANTGRSKNAQ